MNIEVYTAPERVKSWKEIPYSVFLGGTIDNGNSSDWQYELIKELETLHHKFFDKLRIYNPRRSDWNKDADSKMIENQIKWEHKYLDASDIIVMNILPDSLSPISLMEIGMFHKDNKLIIFCTPEFWRYDNVKVICEEYDIPLYNTNDIKTIADVILNY